jgi:hypothetical protein
VKRTPLKPGGPLRKKKRAKTHDAIKKEELLGRSLTRQQLIKLCDVQWSKLVKLNVDRVCEWCGKPAMDSHHMLSRRNMSTRFKPENGVALCKGCHLHYHNNEPITGWHKFQEQRPESYATTMLFKGVEAKYSVLELRAILADLREQVKRFEE